MSITDVYDKVRDIGTKDPGSLVEFSIFSRGWMGCAFPRVINHTLWAMEGATAYKSSGLGDDTMLVLHRGDLGGRRLPGGLLAPKLGSFPS